MLQISLAVASAVQMLVAVIPSGDSDIALICLITLIGTNEVLGDSDLWNERLSFSTKAAVWPLIISFLVIIACEALEIVRLL